MTSKEQERRVVLLWMPADANGEYEEVKFALLELTAETLDILERRAEGVRRLQEHDSDAWAVEWLDLPVAFYDGEFDEFAFFHGATPINGLKCCFILFERPSRAPLKVECQSLHIGPDEDCENDLAIYWTGQLKHSPIQLATVSLSISRLRGVFDAAGESSPRHPILEPKAAIEGVLDYLWQDELADYAVAPSETHIFRHLATLRSWLDEEEQTAETYLALELGSED